MRFSVDFRGSGTDFEDFVDFCAKKEPPGRKKESQIEVILHPKSDFLNVFLMFFECSIFLIC